ncbi:hypothetical protein BDQ17DRAFT_572074 [Cyathus striatus]|nr:hypothetical protein BDQ17DRAFT_572074 [Cyathus striatus]
MIKLLLIAMPPSSIPHLLALPPWHFGYTLHANLGHRSPAILGSPPQAIPTHTRPLLSSKDEHKRNPVRNVGKKLGSSSGCVCISTSLLYLRSKERKYGGKRFIYKSPSPSVVQDET